MTDKGFDEARLHVELMLGHVLGLPRISLYTNFDKPLNGDELARFKALFKRRLNREPLQYILGETHFMGLALGVSPGALIPRPETEILVERVVQRFGSDTRAHLSVLDVGTGSGNVAIAIARYMPQAAVTTIDISEAAIAVARANLARFPGLSVTIEKGDIFTDLLPGRSFDIIVSNPPYISAQEFQSLDPEITEHEPHIALTDAADGFTFIRRIASFAVAHLNAGGCLFMELAHDQEDAAKHIVGETGLRVIGVAPDLAGIPRVLEAEVA